MDILDVYTKTRNSEFQTAFYLSDNNKQEKFEYKVVTTKSYARENTLGVEWIRASMTIDTTYILPFKIGGTIQFEDKTKHIIASVTPKLNNRKNMYLKNDIQGYIINLE